MPALTSTLTPSSEASLYSIEAVSNTALDIAARSFRKLPNVRFNALHPELACDLVERIRYIGGQADASEALSSLIAEYCKANEDKMSAEVM